MPLPDLQDCRPVRSQIAVCHNKEPDIEGEDDEEDEPYRFREGDRERIKEWCEYRKEGDGHANEVNSPAGLSP